jgi:methylated-DNA-[protein]-cysteine S-methyltransferase
MAGIGLGMAAGLALFETAIGPCGIAWGAQGILAVQLPEATADAARARLRRRFPNATEQDPPVIIKDIIANIVAHLSGQARDFSAIALDLDGVPAFHRRVYDAARRIPSGETRSYGDIAKMLGEPGSARAVGQALGRNPFPIIVPCHRVLAAGGAPGGFSARGGATTKFRILAIEGAVLALG